MNPSSFSEREQQQLYRAEKMFLRQFILLKQQNEVPAFILNEDMKKWLSRGRSFSQRLEETAAGEKVREQLLVELENLAQLLCVDQMEREIREELERERRLSQLLRRKVTLEGLHMFLPIVRFRAEGDVEVLLLCLTNKLLTSFMDSDTGTRNKRALITKLNEKTKPLAPQLVQTALNLLLDDPGPHVEVMIPPSQGKIEILDSDLRPRIEASSALIGRQLADAAASCFCLQTSFFRDRLLSFCTAESRSIATAVYRRFTECSWSFSLLDFDESFFTAWEGVLEVCHNMMEERLLRAAASWEQSPPITEEEKESPEALQEAAGHTGRWKVEDPSTIQSSVSFRFCKKRTVILPLSSDPCKHSD